MDWNRCGARLLDMVFSLLLLWSGGAWAPASGPDPGEALFEVPARFESGCPIISLDLTSEQKGRQALDFILDSGTSRSLLLNSRAGRKREFDQGRRGLLIPGASTVYAGIQDFAAPNLDQFNKDLIDRLLGLHVLGVLGADFLAVHDVLVDYGSHRVFVSRSKGAREPSSMADRWTLVGSSAGRGPSSHSNGPLNRHYFVDGIQAAMVPLFVKGRRQYVNANLAGASSPSWRMCVDTWATRSTLPKSLAPGLARTGKSEQVAAAGSTFVADQYKARVRVAAGVDLDLSPLATEETESILGSDAFQGYTVLLQFGRERFRLWPESVWAAFGGSR
ncbi:MAG: hypothetical protein ACYC96_15095 [Fimbriimonadaceae bacterium]